MSEAAPPEGLLRRATRELAKVAALQALGAALAPVSAWALWRLLDERDFGAYAIGGFFIGVGSLVGEEGVVAALLLKKDALTEEECDAAATFLLAVGATSAAIFLACSGVIGRRYHLTPHETNALRGMAPLFLAAPLRAIPTLRLQRALRLGRVARVDVTASVVQQGTAVALAWATRDVWALIGGHLAGAVTQNLLVWRAAPGFTRLSLRWSVLRPVLAYGLRVQGLTAAAFLKDNVAPTYLGAVMGPAAVGLFDFGVKYAQLPVTVVNAFARPQLSVYSRFAPGDPELLAAVTAITRFALLVGLGMLVVLAVGAPAIVPAVYGARWLSSLPVVYGLVANMAGGLIAGPLFALLQAQGHAGLAVRVFAVWTAGTWGLVLALRGEGVGAVAWAHSTVTVATVFWLVRWAERHLGGALLEGYSRACAAALGALGAAWGVRNVPALAGLSKGAGAGALIALGVYVALLAALERGRFVRELRWLIERIAEAARARLAGK
ncbi:MAG: oligosaccharide flippase family protein [Polyangiales bacterium]